MALEVVKANPYLLVLSLIHIYNPIDGKVYIDDDMKAKMEQYLEQYGAKV